MNQTIRAILARFNGDPIAAAIYCHDIMTQYPRLKAEYSQILTDIATRQYELKGKIKPTNVDVYLDEEKVAEAAHAGQ